MIWDEMAVVGRIARAHGIRGQVIVNAETDFPRERFRPGAELLGRRGADTAPETFVITSVRFHRDRPVIGFDGVRDMTTARALAGMELRVPANQLVPLPPGSYYHHDLVGCAVETVDGTRVGVVTSVEGSAGGSRLIVATSGGGEVQVPLAVSICPTIDLAARRIVVAPPEGLLDLR
jgi:16S rRNA processing protein RimM